VLNDVSEYRFHLIDALKAKFETLESS